MVIVKTKSSRHTIINLATHMTEGENEIVLILFAAYLLGPIQPDLFTELWNQSGVALKSSSSTCLGIYGLRKHNMISTPKKSPTVIVSTDAAFAITVRENEISCTKKLEISLSIVSNFVSGWQLPSYIKNFAPIRNDIRAQ